MKNSDFIKDFLVRLKENSHEVQGLGIPESDPELKDRAVLQTDISLLNPLFRILSSIGLNNYVKFEHLTATREMPEMALLTFDLAGMDADLKQEGLPPHSLAMRKYQLFQLPVEHPQCFQPLSADHPAPIKEYKKVYEGEIDVPTGLSERKTCEQLFYLFNRDDRPNAKTSRSMGVSDVVYIDGTQYFYCNLMSFDAITTEGIKIEGGEK